MHLFGFTLPEDSMHITLKGNGQWNALPCMFSQVMTLRDAMSDYYDHASTGDLIKAQNRFAVFSDDDRWVGDLTALTPGEGYLFRRMGEGPVTIRFFRPKANLAPENPKPMTHNPEPSTEHRAHATNMTMIVQIIGENDQCQLSTVNCQLERPTLYAYIGSEQVGMATPLFLDESAEDGLYFLTISSDAIGSTLRFELADGTVLLPNINSQLSTVNYDADAHYGSLTSPVVLTPTDELQTTKIFENGHIIIIRGGERYDPTGKRLTTND